ncbi:MAG: NAD(P)-dependent oxidoreductase [Planctomycetota bacterium]
MEVLITGAAGRVGRVLVEHFLEAGHAVTATDCVLRPDLPVPLDITDLTDRLAVNRLMARGFDAVVHGGNYPNFSSVRPAERLLIENMAMNANVFWSALAIGVERIVFISSIQAMLEMDVDGWKRRPRLSQEHERPAGVSELPLHGRMPGVLGNNTYGMSKVFGEQALLGLTRYYPSLRAASLRPAYVVTDHDLEYFGRRVMRRSHLRREGAMYVHVNDVARACRLVVEGSEPGHETYLLARSPRFTGMTDEQVCAEFFGDVPLKGEVGGPGGLVDLSFERERLGWEPTGERLEFTPPERKTQHA